MDYKPPKNVTSLPTQSASHSASITIHSNGRPPLRTDWVERIFAVLAAAFGRQFSDFWAGVDPDEMKALWARKLAGFYDQPDAIRRALDEATSARFPPNVGEFYALCQKFYITKPFYEVERFSGPGTKRPDIIAEMHEILKSKVSS